MKNNFKLLNIFLLSTIVIGFNAYANNLLEEDDEKVVSSEEKGDEATSKKPKGMPGKKKNIKLLKNSWKMVNIRLWMVLWKFFMKQKKINTI